MQYFGLSVYYDCITFQSFNATIIRAQYFVTTRTTILMKIILKKLYDFCCCFFSPQNFAFQQTYFKTSLNWCPWACKWFLIKCILILLRLDRKIQFEKWTVIIFFQCKYNQICNIRWVGRTHICLGIKAGWIHLGMQLLEAKIYTAVKPIFMEDN